MDKGIGVTSKVPTYATSPQLASKLNEVRVGDARKVNGILQPLKSLSNNLLKLQFISPAFAATHAVWHLGYNALLESGTGLLKDTTLGKAYHDVKDNSAFEKTLIEKGYLPHQYDHASETVDQLINKAAEGSATKKSALKSMLSSINPKNALSDKWASNQAVFHSDNFLRTALIRRNIQQNGMSLEQAAERTSKFMVKYGDLTNSEKAGVRLLMPFYSWTKGNIKAQTAGWLEKPLKQLLPQKALNLLNQEFTGHTMAGNDQNYQNDLATGQTDSTGKPTYIKNPLSSNDIPNLINNQQDFFGNRASKPLDAISVGLTGNTPSGYSITDSNSPTPVRTQKNFGALNQLVPQDLGLQQKAALAEQKGLGIDLNTSQYPSPNTAKPSLRDFLTKGAAGLAGVQIKNPTPQAQKQGAQQYFQNKYMKSLRKKGLL